VCDVPLSHATSSRQHAALCHHNDGRVFLIDLGSSHGTFLDGSQLPPNKPVVLKSGSSIKFGQAPEKFVMRDVESAGAWRSDERVMRGSAATLLQGQQQPQQLLHACICGASRAAACCR
jgi:pSer/pThr/pTyr-binding forkhead associated (FHA) protein